jgi:hypothetical protein
VAAQPPPAPAPAPASPPAAPDAYNSAPPPPAKRRGGCGCGGCLLTLLLILALVGVAIWYFAILPASAGAPGPAVLTVFVAKTDVGRNNSNYDPGRTGQALTTGSSVRTDDPGRASLLFPDGSVTRIAGGSVVTLSEETLDAHGSLQKVTVNQLSGRTYSTVQKLVAGHTFDVQGGSVTTEVRGTDFEIWIRPDKTILIKLFTGKLHVSGRTAIDIVAGQQILVQANGTLGAPAPIAPDPADPFTPWISSEQAATAGNNPGTLQTDLSPAPAAAVGTPTDTAPYQFAGGNLTATLGYPGSVMKLEVVNDAGQIVGAGQGPPPVKVAMSNLPAGGYRGRVTPLVLEAGPESWAVSFASNPPCLSTGAPPNGTPAANQVRVTLSDADLAQILAQGQLSNSSVHITPEPGGGVISGNVNLPTVSLSGAVSIYATSPTLGVTILRASIEGINVTSQVASRVAALSGRSLNSVELGFTVDRVYSCQGAQGGMLVIEGHS